jgi:bis(5'-nucleosyl)-tetraphosphatase (symmetrical)
MQYFIGDVQGCCAPLKTLLAQLGFSPSRDHVHVLGDLVNRGPDSLGVLRLLRDLEGSATCLLGNHDLHLLAVSCGVRSPHRNDTVAPILNAPDRDDWLTWLRHRPLAAWAHGWLMVHAGVLPQWTRQQTLDLAAEVQAALQAPDWSQHLHTMYGNTPDQWHDTLQGDDRRRCIINALTRLRFCDAQGRMEFASKEGAGGAPEGYMPWFEVPGRCTAGTPVAFGHWSTLGLIQRPDLLALDTGCVWGGALTAACLDDAGRVSVVQVPCPQAMKPGL